MVSLDSYVPIPVGLAHRSGPANCGWRVPGRDCFSTDIDALWSTLIEPARLARWLAQVEGDARLDGRFRAHMGRLPGEEAGMQIHVEDLAAHLIERARATASLHPASKN